MKHSVPVVETKAVKREQDLLIDEFSKGLNLVWVLVQMNSVENSSEQTDPDFEQVVTIWLNQMVYIIIETNTA